MAYDPTKPMSPTNSPESMIGDVATTPTGAKVNTTTGALISAPPTTSTITSDLLAPTPAPVVSPTPVTSPISVATLPEATTSVTAPISDVEGLISQLEGRDVKAEATAQTAEQQRGLNEINKQIRLHQARSLEAEQKALKMGETTGFARGEAERTRESNAVRALELSALAQAAQGDLELASTLATDSINEKYKKVEADLRKKRNDIIANYDNLSAADKKRADATLLRLNAEDAFVKEKKANEAAVKKIGETAAANGAPLSLVQKAIATGDTVLANNMLSKYVGTKTSEFGSGIDAQGMTSAQNADFLRISDKYQKDEIVQTGEKGTSAIEIANQVIANPAGAGNQLKILYTLVKSLDPDSAVREGELDLAQRTQSFLGQFSTTLTRITTGQLISPTAAKELAQATKELATVWSNAAKRRNKQYSAQATVANVGNAWESYLSKFDRPYESGGSPQNQEEKIGDIDLTDLNFIF